MAKPPPRRILLVASPGGHLLQMLALEPAWRDLDRVWATLPAADVEHLLAEENVVLCHGPTARNLKNAVRNLLLAWRTVRREKPDVILSTGAALAVPFFIVGRLTRRRLIYVESLTRVKGLALSGRLVYPLTDGFFVQWPETTTRARAKYVGSVL